MSADHGTVEDFLNMLFHVLIAMNTISEVQGRKFSYNLHFLDVIHRTDISCAEIISAHLSFDGT